MITTRKGIEIAIHLDKYVIVVCFVGEWVQTYLFCVAIAILLARCQLFLLGLTLESVCVDSGEVSILVRVAGLLGVAVWPARPSYDKCRKSGLIVAHPLDCIWTSGCNIGCFAVILSCQCCVCTCVCVHVCGLGCSSVACLLCCSLFSLRLISLSLVKQSLAGLGCL